jgi:hypothetical protein
MSHLSQTLERLIEIISVEKLVGLIEKNTNESPIISPKPNISQSNISQSNITVKDYSDDIAKIQEQLVAINSSLLSLSEAIKNVVIGNNECKHIANPDANTVAKVVEEEHIRLNIEEKICCLPTVANTISEIVENMNDKEEEDGIESEEESEDEEADIESEKDEEAKEDISEADIESEEEAKEEEVESEEEAKEEEESKEEEDISEAEESEEEVGVESEEEEAKEKEAEDEEVGVESEEEVKEEEEEAISEANEAEEEEVFEIEIDDVTYYATSEENGILYAVDKDGEVGKQVGIIKDGEPIFS